jgi:hypothetical protein
LPVDEHLGEAGQVSGQLFQVISAVTLYLRWLRLRADVAGVGRWCSKPRQRRPACS